MPFGPHGEKSVAYQMFKKGGHAQKYGQKDDGDSTPFAELWMGAGHEKGPSSSPHYNDQSLAALLTGEKQKYFLGEALPKKFPHLMRPEHGGVPFIFKVLSAGVPLPLQVHPDKEAGERLREKGTIEREDRTVFDTMHKPEIALALTDFEAFLGFAPRKVIESRLKDLPEIRTLAKKRSDNKYGDDENAYDTLVNAAGREGDGWRPMMSNLTGRIMSSEEGELKEVIAAIVEKKSDKKDLEQVLDLVRRCNDAYPHGDSGVVYAPVFMNYASLKPGECLYAPADTIHAWISGTIIECMPSSVNVVNSGFGPKPSEESLEIFTTLLSYKDIPLSKFMLNPQAKDHGRVNLYEVPEEEFDVLGFELGKDDGTKVFNGLTLDGCAVAFCYEGSATIKVTGGDRELEENVLQPGNVVFIADKTKISLATKDEHFRGYMAYTNVL
jgi:mannose-6-phosphate isomerase